MVQEGFHDSLASNLSTAFMAISTLSSLFPHHQETDWFVGPCKWKIICCGIRSGVLAQFIFYPGKIGTQKVEINFLSMTFIEDEPWHLQTNSHQTFITYISVS